MIRGAKMIISRPGYSSVMEFISCGKYALFVPTPGQTEQEYLARYFRHKRYFNFVPQEKMDLKHDLESLTVFKRPDLVPNKISGMLDEILS
jgi:UDP-N-acetylglucosamine:LPS N-acetylglucosamine transferase